MGRAYRKKLGILGEVDLGGGEMEIDEGYLRAVFSGRSMGCAIVMVLVFLSLGIAMVGLGILFFMFEVLWSNEIIFKRVFWVFIVIVLWSGAWKVADLMGDVTRSLIRNPRGHLVIRKGSVDLSVWAGKDRVEKKGAVESVIEGVYIYSKFEGSDFASYQVFVRTSVGNINDIVLAVFINDRKKAFQVREDICKKVGLPDLGEVKGS